MIEARTQTAARSAAKILSGGLKGKIGEARDALLEIISRVEVGIDFIEEDIELEENRHLEEKISAVKPSSPKNKPDNMPEGVATRIADVTVDRVAAAVGAAVTGDTQKAGEAQTMAQFNEQFTHFQDDAPACDVCGSICVRNGTCYRCFNCGNSMGCS